MGAPPATKVILIAWRPVYLAFAIGQRCQSFGFYFWRVLRFVIAQWQLPLDRPRLILLHFEGPACDPTPGLGRLVREREVRFLVQLGFGDVDRAFAQILDGWKRVLFDLQPGAQLLDAHREGPKVLFGLAHLVPANGIATLQPERGLEGDLGEPFLDLKQRWLQVVVKSQRDGPFPVVVADLVEPWEGAAIMTEQTAEQVREKVGTVYRSESRRILATLIRLLGDFDLAEDALHDAFRAALEQWPEEGLPSNPRAWLISAGRFKAIDAKRRLARVDMSRPALAEQFGAHASDVAPPFDDENIEDFG